MRIERFTQRQQLFRKIRANHGQFGTNRLADDGRFVVEQLEERAQFVGGGLHVGQRLRWLESGSVEQRLVVEDRGHVDGAGV